MYDLRDLYQEVILDHSKHPRNFHKLTNANHHAEGFNPLCGDKLTLYLFVDGDVIKDISFEGSGCAISTASSSVLTEILKGKKISEVEPIFEQFHELVTGQKETGKNHTGNIPLPEKLEVFQGVSEFPSRVKCATLPWHTLNAALQDKKMPVSTE